MNLKKAAIIIADIIVPIIVIIIATIAQTTGELDLLTELGEFAFYFLTLLLIVKPLTNLFPKVVFFRKLFIVRREIGHVVFFLALGHGLLYLYNIWAIALTTPFLLGIYGLSILLAMMVTSNKWSIRTMGKWWKWLHKLIYVVLTLIIFHVALLSSEPMKYYIMAAIVVILKIAQFIKIRSNRKKAMENS